MTIRHVPISSQSDVVDELGGLPTIRVSYVDHPVVVLVLVGTADDSEMSGRRILAGHQQMILSPGATSSPVNCSSVKRVCLPVPFTGPPQFLTDSIIIKYYLKHSKALGDVYFAFVRRARAFISWCIRQ